MWTGKVGAGKVGCSKRRAWHTAVLTVRQPTAWHAPVEAAGGAAGTNKLTTAPTQQHSPGTAAHLGGLGGRAVLGVAVARKVKGGQAADVAHALHVRRVLLHKPQDRAWAGLGGWGPGYRPVHSDSLPSIYFNTLEAGFCEMVTNIGMCARLPRTAVTSNNQKQGPIEHLCMEG